MCAAAVCAYAASEGDMLPLTGQVIVYRHDTEVPQHRQTRIVMYLQDTFRRRVLGRSGGQCHINPQIFADIAVHAPRGQRQQHQQYDAHQRPRRACHRQQEQQQHEQQRQCCRTAYDPVLHLAENSRTSGFFTVCSRFVMICSAVYSCRRALASSTRRWAQTSGNTAQTSSGVT